MADHGHENGHSHGENSEYYSKRAQAMQALLIEKGVCTLDDILTMADKIDSRSPEDGAKILAHAWVDPDYKKRLLANAEAAFLELGYDLPETSPKITVLENTDDVHNMAVCTLCSCFPRAIIGRPPAWYKELSYRSKVVVDPRGVLQEFGTVLDEATQVRVIDSSADYRYLILPNRPAGTENMTEEELAKLITQESMIGVGLALSPEAVSAS
ncbi:MAG: nitrile hydratase subunit alpha [SAR202 cluster bacterium]|uniref:Cobalt-containing nitrile hydratase subunit alpha n=2 Tax=ecological metagenomes TaxID=410657 RepID=A0A160VFK7_9ZZZZ|nr:nitrile hydratase subunit alpha [Dehalococcoidia bacterium]MEC9238926.1 nitrile hydratase subunit alpha [Chloroflexota bacterium]MQF91278.1 nitrile hydratase subunit alpha [SAR202 cluster bacterium]MCH2500156.1 nitrile hydratase subunit alpha [Dehalococcoidia bacterium]MED5589082.1 nitrile hydratase subunit alpha [Chloroflexota bacterium]